MGELSIRVFMIQTGIACVVNQETNKLEVKKVENLSIVSLRISKSCVDDAIDRLDLAGPLKVSGSDPCSLWLGPDRWLLVGNNTPEELIDSCEQQLTGILHHAVDYSRALSTQKVIGKDAWRLLASGTSIDLRPAHFTVGSCCRTRLGQVAAVIVANGNDEFSLHVDRSYETYLSDWLAESVSIYCSRFN